VGALGLWPGSGYWSEVSTDPYEPMACSSCGAVLRPSRSPNLRLEVVDGTAQRALRSCQDYASRADRPSQTVSSICALDACAASAGFVNGVVDEDTPALTTLLAIRPLYEPYRSEPGEGVA
jgi:hypothetical protein